MRYAYESYKFRGVELFRVVDTFNGGRVVAKGLTHDTLAIGRRDELNACHKLRSKRDEIAYAEPVSR